MARTAMVLLAVGLAANLASARLTTFSSFLGIAPQQTCATLKNRMSHFTIRIGVGTPAQYFDVVADTGSDHVIVNSCMCALSGHCDEHDKCFRGINKSSTFSLEGLVNDGHTLRGTQSVQPTALVITFGSGQIETIVASDVVQVGQVKTKMEKSLLLMVDKALDFGGPFEGILGLGLPRTPQTEAKLAEEERRQQQKQDGSMKKGKGQGGVGQTQDLSNVMDVRGFLQTAGVQRFSLCFNSQNEDGVLLLSPEKQSEILGSIGAVHWGLGFRGVRVTPGQMANKGADEKAGSFLALSDPPVGSEPKFCNATTLPQGQETACGIIPDSGTTLIMGPAEQIATLFLQICDAWPRCSSSAKSEEMKIKTLQKLLEDCASWMTEDQLNELPSLEFHVTGAGGNEERLTLMPESYIFQYVSEEVKYVRKHLMGIFDVVQEVPTGREVKVCSPAFGAQQYNTVKNGPVWIMGTPLFYQYRVHYNLDTTPPGLAFDSEACGSCSSDVDANDKDQQKGERKPVFISDHGKRHMGRARPWDLRGPPRMPTFGVGPTL